MATNEQDRPFQLYLLVDPRDRQIRYAGATRCVLARRLSDHVAQAVNHPERRGTHKDTWIRALHRAGTRPLIIGVGQATATCWRQAERDLIASLRWMGCRLTNRSAGGEGYVHDIDSDVASRRAATRRANRTLPDGTLKPMYTQAGRAAASARARAQTISAEHRNALRQLRLGSKQSAETVEKRVSKIRGRKQSPEHVAKRVAAGLATRARRVEETASARVRS